MEFSVLEEDHGRALLKLLGLASFSFQPTPGLDNDSCSRLFALLKARSRCLSVEGKYVPMECPMTAAARRLLLSTSERMSDAEIGVLGTEEAAKKLFLAVGAKNTKGEVSLQLVFGVDMTVTAVVLTRMNCKDCLAHASSPVLVLALDEKMEWDLQKFWGHCLAQMIVKSAERSGCRSFGEWLTHCIINKAVNYEHGELGLVVTEKERYERENLELRKLVREGRELVSLFVQEIDK